MKEQGIDAMMSYIHHLGKEVELMPWKGVTMLTDTALDTAKDM